MKQVFSLLAGMAAVAFVGAALLMAGYRAGKDAGARQAPLPAINAEAIAGLMPTVGGAQRAPTPRAVTVEQPSGPGSDYATLTVDALGRVYVRCLYEWPLGEVCPLPWLGPSSRCR